MRRVDVNHFRLNGVKDPLANVLVADDLADRYDQLRATGAAINVRRVKLGAAGQLKIVVQAVAPNGDVWDEYTVPDRGDDISPASTVEQILRTFDTQAFSAAYPLPTPPPPGSP